MARPGHTVKEQYYKSVELTSSLLVKTIVTSVITAISIVIAYLTVDSYIKSGVMLGCTVIIFITCFKELSEGLISVFGGLPTNDTLNAYALVAAAIQSIYFLFVPEEKGLYGWIACLSCTVSMLMKYLYVREIPENIKVIGKHKIYCVEDVNVSLEKRYIDRACLSYRLKKIPNIVGKTYRTDASEHSGFKYVPKVLIVSLIISIISGIIYGLPYFFKALVLLTGICAGFTGEISFVFPYNAVQKKLRKMGCMLMGAFSIDRLKDVKTLIVKDREIFSPDNVRIADIKFIKAEYMSETIVFTSYILKKIKSPLYPAMETYAYNEDNEVLEVTDFKNIQEYGVCAKINGRDVLLGNRNLILSYGLKPLSQEKEAEQTSKGHSVLYIAIDGELSAVILAIYEANPKLKTAVQRTGRDLTVIVESKDPAITAEMVQRRYTMSNATISVTTTEESALIKKVRKSLSAKKKNRPAMLSTQTALGTLSGIEMAQSLSTVLKMSVKMKQISVYAGLILTAIALLTVPALVSPFWVLIFNLLWTIPTLGLCFRFILD